MQNTKLMVERMTAMHLELAAERAAKASLHKVIVLLAIDYLAVPTCNNLSDVCAQTFTAHSVRQGVTTPECVSMFVPWSW